MILLLAPLALLAAVGLPIGVVAYLEQQGNPNAGYGYLLFPVTAYTVYKLYDWWLLKPSRNAPPPVGWDDPGGGDGGWG